MTKNYFDRSQEVRREIESSPRIMEILKNHLTGIKKSKFISGGMHHRIYRIGCLESGLGIAMRHNLSAGSRGIITKGILSGYESYAIDAENYEFEGKRVSQFCVGVANIKNEIRNPSGFQGYIGNAGLLVEDFTNGGTRELEISTADELWASNPRELIHVDLGSDFADLDDFQYMADSNMILL
ncbi:hypothetical protein HOE04_01755 [archaeon]|jgi:hypothetical protein|nr:hypothetical protein [archaeon]